MIQCLTRPIPREEQETVIQADSIGCTVYTTNPAHWRALKRRVTKLGGHIDMVHRNNRGHEVGGQVTLPPSSFSLARFGLRASPPRPPRKD